MIKTIRHNNLNVKYTEGMQSCALAIHNHKLLKRINGLIRKIQRSPFEGIGKPEALKHGLEGYWSRRITNEYRIVYKVEKDAILIAQLRYHY